MNENFSSDNLVLKEYNLGNYIIKLNQIDNVEKLVDDISKDEFNQDERLPYWAEVWPSAIALSKYICDNPTNFKSKNILELGCGVGLVGIAAAYANATVTFSDYENVALQFTQSNYFLNFGKEANIILLDWRNPYHNKKYEIIVAADILYEKRFLEPVYNTIIKLLQKNGQVYIAEPDRSIAKPFFELMKSEFVSQKIQLISAPQVNKQTINLYIYKKC